ncbi:DUF2178 domain-containing protein [Halostella sp. JP-L12]|uniref:DUF2178 domain-containing protein n=1 Tax=Halostella TaxID=1843185 RepID=UPI000EF76552|nr:MULTISPECIES: DUF2178 domain-containing protein [Halostella]NHN49921.1 DUF2178 domain-containing protein [Halostella sp. JP-L12]
MTSTESPTTDRLSSRRRYRRLMFGSIAAAVVSALALRNLGYPLLSEGVYWVGILAFLAVWWGSPVSLFDERDRALERRASQLTLTVAAVVLVLGASAARLLTEATSYAVPTVVWGALYGYVGLFAAFAVAYLWVRYRP